MNKLTTFVTPKPSSFIMKSLVYVNRWLNLKGISFLKWIPLLNKMPFVRGLCDITHIHFSHDDKELLRSYFNKDSVSFIGPNHPEFYTDWMLDKEISSYVSPLMAFWATNDIVNGMGDSMQQFWLKNNLIAQIPGTGNQLAKNYSIQHAISGHGVLLHPEGHVGWHSDTISPLFPGIFDMAQQAYIQTEGKKPVYIVPVIWKLSFNKDVTQELHKEFDYVEKDLQLYHSYGMELNERLYQLLLSVFHKISTQWHISTHHDKTLITTQQLIIQQLSSMIALSLNYTLLHDISADIKNMHKLLKTHSYDNHFQIKNMLHDLVSINDFVFDYYGSTISQENIAELLKKIRLRFCTKGFKNTFHKFIPIPVSSRSAYIQVPKALCINELISQGKNKEEILQLMQNTMQSSLNNINQQLIEQGRVISYENLIC